jgi:Predicted membrane protein (DUF2306)
MFSFSLSRLIYLNVAGDEKTSFKNSASPGEWFWFRQGHYRVGITIHIGCTIPLGLLAVWQFVPVIRHKALIFHRINGYIIIVLTILGNVGALMVSRRAFGGGLDSQSAVISLVIISTVSITMAYYNIKQLQIDQHRAWMLRSMFYLGAIITVRLIQFLSAAIISWDGDYFTVRGCEEIIFIYGSAKPVQSFYPACFNTTYSNNNNVVVKANIYSGRPEQIGASLGISFGPAIWLALLIHLVGVEFYLSLTQAESERLRMVSYERQLIAGFKNPGSAGLTVNRLGDAAPWKPASVSEPNTLAKDI